MSVIVIPDPEDEEERATYIPIEPADPFIEALRLAAEIGAEVVFLERQQRKGRISPIRTRSRIRSSSSESSRMWRLTGCTLSRARPR